MIGSRLLVPIQTRGYFVNKKGHFVKSGLPPLGRRISLTTRLVRRRRLLPRSPAAASCSGLAKSPSPERRDPPAWRSPLCQPGTLLGVVESAGHADGPSRCNIRSMEEEKPSSPPKSSYNHLGLNISKFRFLFLHNKKPLLCDCDTDAPPPPCFCPWR
jgi:hypothetical protein